MPCDAVAYLPARVKVLDTQAIFANAYTRKLACQILNTTLAEALGIAPANYTADWDTNLTAYVTNAVLRIWANGTVSIRVDRSALNPDEQTTQIEAAVATMLAVLTQVKLTSDIAQVARIERTEYVGQNLVLTLNL